MNNKLLNNYEYSNLDMIAYTKLTSNKIEYWNPFEDRKDIQFFENKKTYYILGPINNNDIKYFWNFNVKLNNNELLLSTSSQTNDLDSCITLSIKENIGKINYLNNCYSHKGRDLVGWSIQILSKLGCTKCILIDNAEKKCINRNYNNYVPLSLIHKLWKNETYYEYFYFIPYNKNNHNFKNNKRDELNNYITQLKTLKWNDFNIQNKKWSLFMNKYKFLYEHPFEAFEQFDPNKCGLFYDILDLLDDPSHPCFNLLQKTKNIITKSVWMKLL